MSNRKGKGQVVSRTELAEFFGASGPTVDHWVRTGCPYIQRGGKGVRWEFSTADVSAWLVDRARAEQDDNPDQQDEKKLKTRAQLAKTIQAELDLAKAKAEVAPLDQVYEMLSRTFAEVRANMRSIPSRVVTSLIGETDETRFKRVMLEEIDQALQALADADLTGDADEDADA